MQMYLLFYKYAKESVDQQNLRQSLPSCWNCSYDPFVFTLKLTQNYIIVLNNRFKGFGGSVCVVLCPQELEQQSVRSYLHAHFLVAHALHDVSLLSRIESG